LEDHGLDSVISPDFSGLSISGSSVVWPE